MTCIAAFRAEKGCIMAADTRVAHAHAGVGSWYGQLAYPKIERRIAKRMLPKQEGGNVFEDVPLLFGTRGLVTFATIMDTIDWPDIAEGRSIPQYIMRDVLPLIRKGMKDAEFDPHKQHYESSALVVIGREIISIDARGSVIFHNEEFIALGDGQWAAYGAYDMMVALEGQPQGDDEISNALISVLRIVAKRNWSCDDRVTVMKNYREES